jgi:hypothetical protein
MMRRVALWMLMAGPLGCGGYSGPSQSAVSGTYSTMVTLLDGSTCSPLPQVQDNPTMVAQSAGSAALSLTHAGTTYSGTVDSAGAFSVPATAVGGGANVISIAGQFGGNGFTATAHVDQQQPPCQYDVRWVGTKTSTDPADPYP